MADTKFQGSRTLPVVPSDTINIPEVSGSKLSGSGTATTANKLVDSTQTFTEFADMKGAIVHNTTDGTIATVTAVDSDTTLSLSADIMANTEVYDIYFGSTEDCNIYIGGPGNLKVLTSGGDIATFVGLLPGMFLPINVKRVYDTDTTATNLLAIW